MSKSVAAITGPAGASPRPPPAGWARDFSAPVLVAWDRAKLEEMTEAAKTAVIDAGSETCERRP